MTAAAPPATTTLAPDRAPPAPPQDSRGLPAVHPAVAAWMAHLAAGRIGATPPSDPDIVAARAAMERAVLSRK